MFAAAFGIYPHLNIADAHLAIVRGGVQHCLHASKILYSDRAELSVGPFRIEIVEPLQKLRLIVEETEGVAADVTLTGRHFPIEEPRFIRTASGRARSWTTRASRRRRASQAC